jgi:hypothetical protein
MSGKAAYRPAPGFEHKLHFIGPASRPVWIGRKGDVPGLLNDRFWEVYRAWQEFHLGIARPDRRSSVAEGVLILEGQFRAHFSQQHAVLERLDLILQVLTGGGKKGRRGR